MESEAIEKIKWLHDVTSVATAREPGWDATVIKMVADRVYGGYTELFEQNGWDERGSAMVTAVQGHVGRAWGSVENFLVGHVQAGV